MNRIWGVLIQTIVGAVAIGVGYSLAAALVFCAAGCVFTAGINVVVCELRNGQPDASPQERSQP